ncbi:MAG: hypothetical protein D3926_08995 [Desulfobacteraceae bacterium]|nr:MAG: hypothetical protein D3926_08995 [Desulfobacteraceae bacterium]
MIQQWHEPATFQEWLKRTFSFLNIGLVFFAALFIFSEFRFNWCEKLLGRYLAATNPHRPETGSIWKTGRHTLAANRFLNDIIQKKQEATQKVEQAQTFVELSSGILPGEWVTLQKEQFKSLYRSLPQSISSRLISPARLIWILSGKDLNRIFCEGAVQGLNIYFLDSQNRVIHQLTISSEDIVQIETGVQPISKNIEEIEEFSNSIFSARHFFEAVFMLPEDIIPDLILNPELLLDEKGQIQKVGIWNEAQSGFINLGFEFEANGRKRVVVVKGREWAVWQLGLILRGDTR